MSITSHLLYVIISSFFAYSFLFTYLIIKKYVNSFDVINNYYYIILNTLLMSKYTWEAFNFVKTWAKHLQLGGSLLFELNCYIFWKYKIQFNIINPEKHTIFNFLYICTLINSFIWDNSLNNELIDLFNCLNLFIFTLIIFIFL